MDTWPWVYKVWSVTWCVYLETPYWPAPETVSDSVPATLGVCEILLKPSVVWHDLHPGCCFQRQCNSTRLSIVVVCYKVFVYWFDVKKNHAILFEHKHPDYFIKFVMEQSRNIWLKPFYFFLICPALFLTNEIVP